MDYSQSIFDDLDISHFPDTLFVIFDTQSHSFCAHLKDSLRYLSVFSCYETAETHINNGYIPDVSPDKVVYLQITFDYARHLAQHLQQRSPSPLVGIGLIDVFEAQKIKTHHTL